MLHKKWQVSTSISMSLELTVNGMLCAQMSYAEEQIGNGEKLSHITQHMLGLYSNTASGRKSSSLLDICFRKHHPDSVAAKSWKKHLAEMAQGGRKELSLKWPKEEGRNSP